MFPKTVRLQSHTSDILRLINAATSRNLSQVVLREDSKTLEEVVVVGYGTQKKVNLTGAVAIVSGDELTTRSAANLSQLLQGSVPNMNVNFSSDVPDKGEASISVESTPLVRMQHL